MSESKTECPKCGASKKNLGPVGQQILDSVQTIEWECGSSMYTPAEHFSHGDRCVESRITRLKSALAEAEETFTAPDGEVWSRPTAEAYYRACQALKSRRGEVDAATARADGLATALRACSAELGWLIAQGNDSDSVKRACAFAAEVLAAQAEEAEGE